MPKNRVTKGCNFIIFFSLSIYFLIFFIFSYNYLFSLFLNIANIKIFNQSTNKYNI